MPPRPRRTQRWKSDYSKLVNGLLQTWEKLRVWLDPPFSNIAQWVRKARIEAAKGKRIAMYLPMLAASHEMIAAGAEVVALGRVGWLEANTKEPWQHPTYTGLFMLNCAKEPS